MRSVAMQLAGKALSGARDGRRKAWNSWVHAASLMVPIRTALARMVRHELLRGWNQWTSHTREQRQSAVHRAARHMLHHELSRGYGQWRVHTAR